MDGPLDRVLASAVNPFDKSYHHLQHKFDGRVIKLLSGILYLNLTLVRTPLVTDLMGYERNPDSWILEQIVNGSAEMSSTTLILSPNSSSMVDYSYAIGTFRPQLYYKARSLREDYNIYLIPFSSKLWISLIAAILLLTMTLIFILSREAKLPHEISYDVLARIIDIQQERDEESAQDIGNPSKEFLMQKEKWELGEILLVCLGAICQQGSARDPSTSAARILLLVFFLLTVVGYTAYSASIISLISLFPSTELEQSGNVDVFSRQYETLLHNTNNVDEISRLGFCQIRFTNIRTGFEKVLKGEAVFVGDRDVSLTVLQSENYDANLRCQLGRVFLGVEYHRVFAFKNNFKYKDKINYNILRLRQFGLLERERRIFKAKSPCTFKERSSGSNFISFNQNDVQPVVNLFKLGLLTSLVLLISENIIFYWPAGVKTLIWKLMGGRDKEKLRQLDQNYKSKNLIRQNKVKETSSRHKEIMSLLSITKPCFSKRVPQQQFIL